MDLTFLSCAESLTKKFVLQPDGTIEKTSFLNAYKVTSHQTTVASLKDFFLKLRIHADLGHVLLKGNVTRPLIDESRAGSTDSNAPTSWVCLDIDGLPPTHSIDQLLTLMGLGDISYILQWSASQSILNESLRCHIMMLLSKPASAPLLKQWLTQLNHQTEFLRDHLNLTKTNLALSWGLDITACQNDKLIYIAPPILVGVKNPLGRKPRYELIEKSKAKLSLPATINTPEQNRQLSQERITALRAAASLPARKNTYKTYKDTEVLSKPDEAMITDIRHDRGFTYFNFNGGDSWAYYHPDDNCEIIYNFKGEPNYATKELLPDYYKQAKAAASNNASAESSIGAYLADPQQPVLLAYRERKTGVYYHGSFDPAVNDLRLDVAKSEKQVRDFCMQFGMPMGDFIPIWDMVFEPNSRNPRIDVENRTINMFSETEYMLNVGKKAPAAIPKTIFKIMSHMLAGDAATIAHLLNWLAFIVQRRERPKTAWVWYGTEGTGKGMFASKILRPLLGMQQTAMRPGSILASEFNAYMKNQLVCFFDEAHVAEMKDSESIHAKLRNWITEPTISIRAMHANSVEVDNHAALILMSNKPNVILLQKKDRRWNVAPFQEVKLELTDEEIDEKIPAELQAFYDYLAHYPLDEVAARTPLVTEDRDRLISTTTSSADDVAHALAAKKADMGFFLDQLPSDGSLIGYRLQSSVQDYKKVLHTLILRTRNEGTGRCKISRDELHMMFEYTVGNMPNSPNKFTKFLAHRHIHTEKVRIDKPVYGIQVEWKDWTLFNDYDRDFFPAQAPVAVKVKDKK
jgi:hypothetical protein